MKIRMKCRTAAALMFTTCGLAACSTDSSYGSGDTGVSYDDGRKGYAYGINPGGDRDWDGIPDSLDRDRDGDGVPNRLDFRPNNPRWR